MGISRRAFARASAGAASAFSLSRGGWLWAAQGGSSGGDAGWFDKPMRWAQLTLVENDPGRYSASFWLDYFRRCHADAACLSAGGCVAYYPTKIPLHHRSKWMANTDPFGELLAGCREMGMVVLARTDSHAIHQDAADAHPEWIAVDADGKPRRHWAQPELWVSCALGTYNFEFMTEVHREILRDYKVDGIFTNRWAGSGMCYCEQCQKNFQAAYGMDLPRTRNPQDPSRKNYILWRQQRLFELWRLWDGEIRKLNSDSRYIANAGGGAMSELDMKTIGALAPTLFADRQARRGLEPPWSNGKNGKEYRATLGKKAIGGIFSIGVEEPYRWKDSVQSDEEIRIWVAEGTANGLRPWFTKFSGTLHDRRWLKPVEEIYGWHFEHEKYLRNTEALAQVAMVYSQQTATFYGGDRGRQKVEDHTEGYYHALIEARIPFEMVHDRLLDAAHVDRFRVLILPNIAALSDSQCAQIRSYVQRGGSIVATHETSLYDEWGVRRKNFGLASLFGVSYAGRVEERMQNAYLRLEHPHPLLRGLEDAERIIHGVQRVHVKRDRAFPSPALTLIPSYPDLPMEEVYPRVEKTNIAEVYLRNAGRGRVAYFPWDIDRTFWEVLSPDHGKLLVNAVDWAMGEERMLTVDGAGFVDATVWRQKDCLTVHVVNLTNPMMMKGPYREVIPLSGLVVNLRVPKGLVIRKVQLLVSGEERQVEVREGVIRVELPAVGIHEVIALDVA